MIQSGRDTVFLSSGAIRHPDQRIIDIIIGPVIEILRLEIVLLAQDEASDEIRIPIIVLGIQDHVGAEVPTASYKKGSTNGNAGVEVRWSSDLL